MLNIETFYYLCGMERKIRTYGGYFQAFIKTLDDKVLRKIDYVLQLLKIRERLSTKFVKAIKDGLFELRIEYEGNIYRVFFSLMKDRSLSFLMDSKRRRRRHLRVK